MPRNYVCFFLFFFCLIFFGIGHLKLIYFDFDIGRKAAFGIRAVNRMATLAHSEHDTGKALREQIFNFQQESAKVCF